MKRVIVFDESNVEHSLLHYDLTQLKYNVIFCDCENEITNILNTEDVHVLLLNYDWEKIDSFNFCKLLRENNKDIYIIAISNRNDVLSKLEAFKAGVDDYIIAPYAVREVIARINVFFRRNTCVEEGISLDYKHLKMYPGKREMYCDNKLIHLTYKEFELARYLIENRNIVVSREMILLKVWKYEYSGETRVIDMYISKIREKLKLENYLKTVRSVGYMLVD